MRIFVPTRWNLAYISGETDCYSEHFSSRIFLDFHPSSSPGSQLTFFGTSVQITVSRLVAADFIARGAWMLTSC